MHMKCTQSKAYATYKAQNRAENEAEKLQQIFLAQELQDTASYQSYSDNRLGLINHAI